MRLLGLCSCSILLLVIARTRARARAALPSSASTPPSSEDSSEDSLLNFAPDRISSDLPMVVDQPPPQADSLPIHELPPHLFPFRRPLGPDSDPYSSALVFDDAYIGASPDLLVDGTDLGLQDSTSDLFTTSQDPTLDLFSTFQSPRLDSDPLNLAPDPILAIPDSGFEAETSLIADVGPQCQKKIYPNPLCCSINANIAKSEYENEVNACTERKSISVVPFPRGK